MQYQPGIHIAIVSDSTHIPGAQSPFQDDQDLLKELQDRRASVEIIDWREAGINWQKFDAIFISSTWDIPSYGEEFMHWIRTCNADKKRTINDGQLICDNVIKSRYLSRLIQYFGHQPGASAAITPSCFIALKASAEDSTNALGNHNLTSLCRELAMADPANWENRPVVMKPIVSADGNNTFLYHPSLVNSESAIPDSTLIAEEEAEQVFQQLLRHSSRGIILQPYIKAVEEGEYCLVFLHDRFSHAIQKKGGFKNHSIRERRYIPEDKLPAGMLSFGKEIIQYMQQLYHATALTRTRIDFLHSNHQTVLCELECTEPNTNLQSLPEATRKMVTRNYAQAIYEQAIRLKMESNSY
ncbi:hypothetical protein [Flavihumibacter sp. CACIAM 22H1]|uniref:ATP-grasp domain-containing protein n=1 Tax=Flavihumibacter sp. CACIAM 22H1 TaxID=1812911 RepID=UPI0007A84E7D|nr:hypothetical protein [Flavihumibacter sp. CACIAM 22H1]KYP16036.1 MAG: hypothetical protein A1D16_18345 [Flavihumibacter sp. CACIAM 22H1]